MPSVPDQNLAVMKRECGHADSLFSRQDRAKYASCYVFAARRLGVDEEVAFNPRYQTEIERECGRGPIFGNLQSAVEVFSRG